MSVATSWPTAAPIAEPTITPGLPTPAPSAHPSSKPSASPSAAPTIAAACSSYTVINDTTREVGASPWCNGGVCGDDSGLFQSGSWYRFTDVNNFNFVADKQVVNGPTGGLSSNYFCGNPRNSYVNGVHPTVAQGQVSLTMCFPLGYTGTQWPCDTSYQPPVNIIQCSGYFVYNFPSGISGRVCTTGPPGFVNPAALNCASPCATCEFNATGCASCVPGFQLIGNACQGAK